MTKVAEKRTVGSGVSRREGGGGSEEGEGRTRGAAGEWTNETVGRWEETEWLKESVGVQGESIVMVMIENEIDRWRWGEEKEQRWKGDKCGLTRG